MNQISKVFEQLKAPDSNRIIMEICGTHTMSIAKCGLKQFLPSWVKLVSGPGCPVCVTPSNYIDECIRIAYENDVIICSYGDLLRIPGSEKGNSLKTAKAKGGDIRIVYSPMDALDIAINHPDKHIIFIAVGFETTAPGTAISLMEAKNQGIKNYFVLSLMKYTLPAIDKLLEDPKCRLDGLICPGHVATIIGADAFRYLPEEKGIPAVVAGFESEQIIEGVYDLCKMLSESKADLKNDYASCVNEKGNAFAKEAIHEVFEPVDDVWRGLGIIKKSGMALRTEYEVFDAKMVFKFSPLPEKADGCACGSVLMGMIEPSKCPHFGKDCTPMDPLGPCMVSSEGACAAFYKYRGLEDVG